MHERMRLELDGVPKSQKMSVASSVVLAPRCLPTAMEKSTRRRLPTAMEEGNKDELRRIAKATRKGSKPSAGAESLFDTERSLDKASLGKGAVLEVL